MRTILLTLLLVALPFSVTFGQAACVGSGALFENGGKTAFSSFAGTKVSIYTDSASGFQTFNRTGYFYANADEGEIQGAFSWLMTSKQTGFWNAYVAIGTGMLWEFEDGSDEQDMGLKGEFGIQLTRGLVLGLGVDYLPIRDVSDKANAYLLVDLTR